ncbi:hypothetical protein ACIRSU_27610 [Streptomyces sp. NPDC101160]|uniref:hypothetical protein n=1 Tax=Streptomyces sp. NPDC101160 TaxID=3366118 RepID=UPI0037F8E29C
MLLTRRAAAFGAAAVLVLTPVVAGCSDNSGNNSSPSQVTPTTSPTMTDQPLDPVAAKAQITKNWTAFFDPKTPPDQRIKLLENGQKMAPVLGAFAGNKNAAATSVKVTQISFTSPTGANVTYDLLVAGNTALPHAKGTAVLQDNTWKVSEKTLCGLVQLSGTNQVPGC